MSFQKATREQRIPKIGLLGPAGSGKTKGALLLMEGIIGDKPYVVLDTENYSSSIYANKHDFSVCDLSDVVVSPKIIKEKMEEALKEGFKGIIIDSATPAWDYLVDMSNKTEGNSFQNWGKTFTPIQRDFIKYINKFPVPVICTIRQESQYVIETNDKGKMVPKKVGLKAQQGKGLEFELDLVFAIDQSTHKARIDKGRYEELEQYFDEQGGEVKLTKEVGQLLRKTFKGE